MWLALVPVVMLVDRPLYEAYGRWVGGLISLDWAAQFFTNAVAVQWIGLGAIVLVIADRRLRWWFMGEVTAVMIAQAGVVEVVKRLFGRLRPEKAAHLTIFRGPDFAHSNYCFPSGHAAAAFALAGVLSAWYPRWRWAFIAVAICVCLARLQLQRHFPSDLLFGAWVGWVLAGGILTCQRRWTHRQRRARTGPGDERAATQA
ncbi:phosphatase PAP2 family protein [bacterium]|nr:phosphatase PAP2 family protein [bacterium]